MNTLYTTSYIDSFALCRSGTVGWLNEDEIYENFEKYVLIFRLTPYSAIFSDTWSFAAQRLVVNDQCIPSILGKIRETLKLEKITVCDCRRDKYSRDWKIIHEVFSDPLMTAEAEFSPKDAVCVAVNSRGKCAIFSMADGQVLLGGRDYDGVWRIRENLTLTIVQYLAKNSQLVENLNVDANKEDSVDSENAATALFHLRASRFCSTKCWIWIPRLEAKDVVNDYALSVQSDSSILVWKSSTQFMRNDDTKIVHVRLNTLKETISAVTFGCEQFDGGFMFTGCNSGNIYATRIRFDCKLIEKVKIDESTCILENDDDLRVVCIKFKVLEDNKYLLTAARQATLLVACLSVKNGSVCVFGSHTCRTAARFPIKDVFDYDVGMMAYSQDATMTLRCEMSNADRKKTLYAISLTSSSFPITNENEFEIFGLAKSPNEAFLSYCLRKRNVDKYDCKRMNSFHIASSLSPFTIWGSLIRKESLISCSDLLTCLRATFLSKDIFQDIMENIESSLSRLEDVSNCHLKVIRFALILMKNRNESTEEEKSAWSSKMVQVERLLLRKYIERILHPLHETYPDQSPKVVVISQTTLACVKTFEAWMTLNGYENFDVDDHLLSSERCPICGSTSLEWSSSNVFEKVCSEQHKIPVCCLTLAPIAEFTCCKCIRCELPARHVERDLMRELESLCGSEILCPYCDGFFV